MYQLNTDKIMRIYLKDLREDIIRDIGNYGINPVVNCFLFAGTSVLIPSKDNDKEIFKEYELDQIEGYDDSIEDGLTYDHGNYILIVEQ